MQNNNIHLVNAKFDDLTLKYQLLEKELELAKNEKNEYKEIIENANSAIIKISDNDIIVHINSFAKSLFKKDFSKSLIGKKFSDSLINLNFGENQNIIKFLKKLPYKPKEFEIFDSVDIL